MTDDNTSGPGCDDRLPSRNAPGSSSERADPDATPTVSCARCDDTWVLDYELDELQVGNRALEQFALDHRRHTGHFPDDVTPWLVDCRQCPDEDAFLSAEPARRWARTHARHTRHEVQVVPPEGGPDPDPDQVDRG